MYDLRVIPDQPAGRRPRRQRVNTVCPVINTRSEQVREAIGQIAAEILREPGLAVSSDDDLRDGLGLDSADVAELIVRLEEQLGVRLPDDALQVRDDEDPLATVGSLARTVVDRMSNAAG
jgi:acyl carrier protein